MPIVLTVDDSRAVRTIVSKQVRDLGFEVQEAEDGVQGLAKLADTRFDLVILDVTMPNMDGPTMLAKLREGGNTTPVIMLTSESKRSVVAGAMKSGITDYILKPFKPEELRAKILAVMQGDDGAVQAAPAGGAAAPAAAPAPAGKEPVDLLLVDDMENVHKRLRGMVPQALTMKAFTTGPAALSAARDAACKVVIVDTEIPEVNSAVLAQQLKVLQPGATFVALALRTANDQTKELKEQGFADVLYKPFTQDHVEDFLAQYFDNQDSLVAQENVLRVAPFTGKPERLEKWFGRLGQLFPTVLSQLAAACHDSVVVDLGTMPPEGDRLAKLLISVSRQARDMGMELTLVGSPDTQKLLAGFEETSSMRFCASVEEARAAA
jgi:DNA-binding response OmpR family regulator